MIAVVGAIQAMPGTWRAARGVVGAGPMVAVLRSWWPPGGPERWATGGVGVAVVGGGVAVTVALGVSALLRLVLAPPRLAGGRRLSARRRADHVGVRRMVERWSSAVRRRVCRAQSIDAAEWAEFLGGLARAARSGVTLRAAVAEAATTTTLVPVRRMAAHLAAGSALDEAVDRAVPRATTHDALAAVVLRTCAGAGGDTARALDAAAESMRERLALEAERDVQATQARMSARVLSALPAAVAVWTLASDRRTRAVWFDAPVGPSVLAAGLALNALGWWWMHRIVQDT